MSLKKEIRRNFRNVCFKRDKYNCVTCNFSSSLETAEEELDCHHITPREDMPNGGYILENGISLCRLCHIKAEEFYATGKAHPGFHPNELYQKIKSSKEKAIAADYK
jgi:5-methylcytosine-specific restriction endonuclease McrA